MAWWDDFNNTISGVVKTASNTAATAKKRSSVATSGRSSIGNGMGSGSSSGRSSVGNGVGSGGISNGVGSGGVSNGVGQSQRSSGSSSNDQAQAQAAAQRQAQAQAAAQRQRQVQASADAQVAHRTELDRQAPIAAAAHRAELDRQGAIAQEAHQAELDRQAQVHTDEAAAKQAAIDDRTVIIPDAQADPDYMRARNDLSRQLSGFHNQQELANRQYKGSYDDSLNQMGWRGNKFDQNDRTGSYGMSYRDNENDFAGRGLADSGLRVQALSMLNDNYNQKKTGLDRGRSDYQDTQAQALSNYTSDNKSSLQNAEAEAVARIAAKYGVGTNVVPKGTGQKSFVKPA